VKGGAITSSPGPKPASIEATCSGDVPLVHPEDARIAQRRREIALEVLHILAQAKPVGVVRGRQGGQRFGAKRAMLEGTDRERDLHARPIFFARGRDQLFKARCFRLEINPDSGRFHGCAGLGSDACRPGAWSLRDRASPPRPARRSTGPRRNWRKRMASAPRARKSGRRRIPAKSPAPSCIPGGCRTMAYAPSSFVTRMSRFEVFRDDEDLRAVQASRFAIRASAKFFGGGPFRLALDLQVANRRSAGPSPRPPGDAQSSEGSDVLEEPEKTPRRNIGPRWRW